MGCALTRVAVLSGLGVLASLVLGLLAGLVLAVLAKPMVGALASIVLGGLLDSCSPCSPDSFSRYSSWPPVMFSSISRSGLTLVFSWFQHAILTMLSFVAVS